MLLQDRETPLADWRIFYKDSTYTYLIPTDYIPASMFPQNVFSDIIDEYEGGKGCWGASPMMAWPTWELADSFLFTDFYSLMEYSGIRTVYAMMNLLCTTPWSNFVNTTYADAAIGGTTLDMLCASWNAKYPSQQLYCGLDTDNCRYMVGKSVSGLSSSVDVMDYAGYNNTLYFPHNGKLGYIGYWIASFFGNSYEYGYVRGTGTIQGGSEYEYQRLRPIVRLKSTTKAYQDVDGIWQLESSGTETQLVTSVSLNPSSDQIKNVGQSFTITPTVAPTTANNKKVNWSSSDTSVATVSSTQTTSGTAITVSCLKAGTTTIKATAADGSGKLASISLTVYDRVTVKTFGYTENDVKIGSSSATPTLAITGTAKSGPTYSSSNTGVATVGTDGKVKGVSRGSATITVSYTNFDDTKSTETFTWYVYGPYISSNTNTQGATVDISSGTNVDKYSLPAQATSDGELTTLTTGYAAYVEFGQSITGVKFGYNDSAMPTSATSNATQARHATNTVFWTNYTVCCTQNYKYTYIEVTLSSGDVRIIKVTRAGTSYTSKVTKLEVTVAEVVQTEDTRVGYYADINNDGTVDGVIYADLNYGVSGQWGGSSGTFSYTTKSTTNTYNVSTNEYYGEFGRNYIITPKTTGGSDRFYVMALQDLSTTGYKWYEGYKGAQIEIGQTVAESGNDFGQGKGLTDALIEYCTQGSAPAVGDSLWSVVQGCKTTKWFVPTKSEWSAFGYNLGITSQNYTNFSLDSFYWTSSVYSPDIAYRSDPYRWYHKCYDFLFNLQSTP